jgi:hypothetical protein
MALQLGALRNALLEAGVKQETADKAAEEVAGYEREFNGLRTDMAREFNSVRFEITREFNAVRSEMAHEFNAVRTEMAQGFSSVRADMARESATSLADRDDLRSDSKVLKWAQAVTSAGVLAILLKTFFH